MVCPGCARRYAGVIDADCPICDGIGVLPLGRPALAIAPPQAVARAVQLILEDAARQAAHRPQPERPEAVATAILEARHRGLLHHGPTGGAPARSAPDELPPSSHDQTAAHLTLTAGHNPNPGLLDHPPAPDGPARARPQRHLPAVLSLNGHAGHLARTVDPILDLGPDTTAHAATRTAHEWRARVLATTVKETTP